MVTSEEQVKQVASTPLDRAQGPAHVQIEQRLADAIAAGDLEPGDRLPPEPELAARFGVSRMTLRQALGRLERRGLIARTVGRGGGTFVAEPKLERDVSTFAGLSEQLRRQGLAPGARVVRAREIPAGAAVAHGLELEPGELVYEIERVRLADGEPIVIERTAFPVEPFPGLLDHALDAPLYDLLRTRYPDSPRRAVERLEPTLAGPDDAALLEVPEGTPLMLVERVAYGDAAAPLEFSRELYRGDRTRVVVWISEVE
jgi:GntR family transcriptional regulator